MQRSTPSAGDAAGRGDGPRSGDADGSAQSAAAVPVSFLADLPVARRAARLAAEAHAGQLREFDGAPFVVHPLEVAMHLHGAGYRDEVVAVGVLHEILEKTAVAHDALVDAFGAPLAAMVEALSEDTAIPVYAERKADLRLRAAAAGDEVLAVFAADKLVKARELHVAAIADRLSATDAARRRAHYAATLTILEDRLPEHPFAIALRFELEVQLTLPTLAWLGWADG